MSDEEEIQNDNQVPKPIISIPGLDKKALRDYRKAQYQRWLESCQKPLKRKFFWLGWYPQTSWTEYIETGTSHITFTDINPQIAKQIKAKDVILCYAPEFQRFLGAVAVKTPPEITQDATQVFSANVSVFRVFNLFTSAALSISDLKHKLRFWHDGRHSKHKTALMYRTLCKLTAVDGIFIYRTIETDYHRLALMPFAPEHPIDDYRTKLAPIKRRVRRPSSTDTYQLFYENTLLPLVNIYQKRPVPTPWYDFPRYVYNIFQREVNEAYSDVLLCLKVSPLLVPGVNALITI